MSRQMVSDAIRRIVGSVGCSGAQPTLYTCSLVTALSGLPGGTCSCWTPRASWKPSRRSACEQPWSNERYAHATLLRPRTPPMVVRSAPRALRRALPRSAVLVWLASGRQAGRCPANDPPVCTVGPDEAAAESRSLALTGVPSEAHVWSGREGPCVPPAPRPCPVPVPGAQFHIATFPGLEYGLVMAGAPARPDWPQPDRLGPAAGVQRPRPALSSALSPCSKLGGTPAL